MLTYKFDNSNPEALTVFLVGELREDALLPELPDSGNRIVVNLDMMTGLNSVGTRLWCRWIEEAQNKFREIFIEEAPMLFVKAFGQIQGALTKNCKVMSLKVPYYSDALGENKLVTVRMNEHYAYDGPFKMPEVKDSLGQPMEIDVIEESYFSFLRL